MSQRKAERNAGAFLTPTDGSMIPVPMRTLSDDYHDEPTDPPDDRVPDPEQASLFHRMLDRLGRRPSTGH